MNCNRSTAHEVFINRANRRTLGYLHSPYSDFVRRRARPRCDPHWHSLGDPRGRRKASGRENQERQVYQEARRKRKMSRIISAALTRNNGAYSTSRVRMGALTPWLRLYPNRPIMSSRCKKIFQILQKAHENRWLSLLKIETMRLRCFDRLCYFRTKNDFTAKSYTGVIHRLRHNCCFRSSLR